MKIKMQCFCPARFAGPAVPSGPLSSGLSRPALEILGHILCPLSDILSLRPWEGDEMGRRKHCLSRPNRLPLVKAVTPSSRLRAQVSRDFCASVVWWSNRTAGVDTLVEGPVPAWRQGHSRALGHPASVGSSLCFGIISIPVHSDLPHQPQTSTPPQARTG